MKSTTAHKDIELLIENIERVIVGKHDAVCLAVASLLSGGHLLLEDKPGTGKTVLAKTLARSIQCDFKRIQCTPDLLPIDITGYVDPRTGEFKRGPVFAQILLADELNRATPRTQSALLEAMAEGQVSVDGKSHPLAPPFMVIATQNPIEHRGVNDLPEAQLDRFQMVLSLGYPGKPEEERILVERMRDDPLSGVQPVLEARRVLELIAEAARVTIDRRIVQYILYIADGTRISPDLALGVSTRAALQLMSLSRAYALIQRRDFVTPDDVKLLAPLCFAHRIIPRQYQGDPSGRFSSQQKIIKALVDKIVMLKVEL